MDEVPLIVRWGKEVSFTTKTKLFISHLLFCKFDESLPKFVTYKGKHLNFIEIVGFVVRESNKDFFKLITIDDGTGLLDCIIKEDVIRSIKHLPVDDVSGMVEVVPFSLLGQTIDGDGDLSAIQLKVMSFSSIIDANEEYIHWIEVIKRENVVFK